MSKLRFLVSLITEDNDYQQEQASAAKRAATELGIEAEIIFAGNDAITQSTQVLIAIQSEANVRPNGIVVEPVGATSFAQAAKAASSAGVGWAVLSRKAEYAPEIRGGGAPVFSISADQVEVGRIQGRLANALLPRGGAVLCIQGPSVSSVSRDRLNGLQEVLPRNVHMTHLRGKWTEESGYQSVRAWIQLMASQKASVDAIVAQNDQMGKGARKAIEESIKGAEREDWLRAPIIGCDGVPATGQAWVRAGILAATVITPPSAGRALTLMARALEQKTPVAEHTFIETVAFPAVETLAASARGTTPT